MAEDPYTQMMAAIASLSAKVDGVMMQGARLRGKVDEMSNLSGSFRIEMRDEFGEVKDIVNNHAEEDTRRFEALGVALDNKVSAVYEHVNSQENERRKRVWQATGVICGIVVGVASLVIAAIKAGWL